MVDWHKLGNPNIKDGRVTFNIKVLIWLKSIINGECPIWFYREESAHYAQSHCFSLGNICEWGLTFYNILMINLRFLKKIS